jgi:hypothetical protein
MGSICKCTEHPDENILISQVTANNNQEKNGLVFEKNIQTISV